VLHNLVIETTRLGIEVKNLKMRVESLTGRLEFNERRARALESVVVYKAPDDRDRGGSGRASHPGEPVATPPQAAAPSPSGQASEPGEGPGQRSRRRRRRRGRRGGGLASSIMGGQAPAAASPDAQNLDRAMPSDASPEPEPSAGDPGHGEE
jgi:hypothetical protein